MIILEHKVLKVLLVKEMLKNLELDLEILLMILKIRKNNSLSKDLEN
nr:MAG TPA: hypothetical protein [Bacteriophage sp.]